MNIQHELDIIEKHISESTNFNTTIELLKEKRRLQDLLNTIKFNKCFKKGF